MYSLIVPFRKARNWWFHLCTGRSDYDKADEEHHRQRILVMTSAFWLITVVLFIVIVTLFTPLTLQGRVAAEVLFGATLVGVLVSMLILRFKQDRITALNVMLLIYGSSFAAACFFFGGTKSPTFPLMILIPVMASIVGSTSLCVAWGLLVLAFWLGLFQVERGGMETLQIILPQNYSLAMLLTYAAMAVAVVSIVLIYSEMNKVLRQSLQESNDELEHLSSHDQLTRLPNRRFYDERIALALRRAAEHGGLVGLLILDLDGFKKINDAHGHGAGDKLLQAVAHRIQVNLRETDLVARLGGDEFVAVIEDVISPDEITRIAHKLSQAIEQPLYVRQQLLDFSASIGVAVFPIDGRQQHELEEKADKAMYLAKKRGVGVALANLESDKVPTPVRAPINRR